MGKPTGFLEFKRALPAYRPVEERLKDYGEFELKWPNELLAQQGARCMDCAVPTCHAYGHGCPLGNLIPDWNDLVFRGDWEGAIRELHRTNNFPEVTGRVCPAPCEAACILGINSDPVTIKKIEKSIVDRAFQEGWVVAAPAPRRTGKRVAVVGSGPAGLAAAQQLGRQGHDVVVFEQADRFGGLLTYGIPNFKMEKHIVERRVEQMRGEGVQFKANTCVGRDITAAELLAGYDAIVLAGGAMQARALEANVEGRQLEGIHYAMDFLPQQNRRNFGETVPPQQAILATGKRVVILGGGDTGSDCLGTSHRQRAREVLQYEILPRPDPLKSSSSHEEGGLRRWNVLTKGFRGSNGHVEELYGCEVEWLPPEQPGGRPLMREVPGTAFSERVELVLLAMGFLGPVREGLLQELGVKLDERSNVDRDAQYRTSIPKVFVAGDMGRGASLVVWAIWEGREAARCVGQYLMGAE
ncbi:MAG: glutamate synthase subunit beta [Candidatus Lambdaproteobacteria bacterium]|nr:glutamate synthase subunit beta [Candidatus Lambdaproteobacteria bacterium]